MRRKKSTMFNSSTGQWKSEISSSISSLILYKSSLIEQ